MTHNALTSLPSHIALMANIRKLYLSDNSIERLPAELCALRDLQVGLTFQHIMMWNYFYQFVTAVIDCIDHWLVGQIWRLLCG